MNDLNKSKKEAVNHKRARLTTTIRILRSRLEAIEKNCEDDQYPLEMLQHDLNDFMIMSINMIFKLLGAD